MIIFSSSIFSGSESSGIISATVIISRGIVSSRDINVSITFTEGNATGTVCIKKSLYYIYLYGTAHFKLDRAHVWHVLDTTHFSFRTRADIRALARSKT